jgi:hypothetical protein
MKGLGVLLLALVVALANGFLAICTSSREYGVISFTVKSKGRCSPLGPGPNQRCAVGRSAIHVPAMRPERGGPGPIPPEGRGIFQC